MSRKTIAPTLCRFFGSKRPPNRITLIEGVMMQGELRDLLSFVRAGKRLLRDPFSQETLPMERALARLERASGRKP